MVFSGDLSGISLPDVFQNLAGNRATGTLRVRWDKGDRYVRFAEGAIAAWSPGAGTTFSIIDHVAERGHADQAAVDKLVQSLKRRRKRPARLLLDEKLVDRQGLETAFREIVAEGIYELLTLQTAEFTFDAGDAHRELFDIDLLAAELRMEVGPVLLEGARRADDMVRIRNVVGSDEDLFVADAHAVDQAPDDATADVAACLDGRTDVKGLARLTQMSRFAVKSALLTLVQNGLARPASGEEIAALAEQALADEDDQEAIRLLSQALVRLPREAVLRRRLAETLAAAGRKREAAGEMAVLAFQLTEEERYADALDHYDRAIALDAADVLLHQRRCDVLRRMGDRSALRDGLLQWAARLEKLGLADRACDVLAEHCDSGPLRHDQQLLQRLAELARANGNLPEAARRYLQIADLHGGTDTAIELESLRRALECAPDDQATARRLADLESGRAVRRRKQRRVLISAAMAATVVLSVVAAAAQELTASRELASILRNRPADALGMATLPALRELAASHTWLPSCQVADAVAGEEAMRLVRAAEQLRLQGRIGEAMRALDVARDSLTEAGANRAEDMVARLQAEQPLFEALERVEQRGSSDGEACQTLARAGEPQFAAFLRDMLPRVETDAARQHILLAMQALGHPDDAESLVRVFLKSRSETVRRMSRDLLARIATSQPDPTRQALDALLRRARELPESRGDAEALLALLVDGSDELAAPGK